MARPKEPQKTSIAKHGRVQKSMGHKLSGKRKSGKKKEPKPKLFGPDILQWGRGLPRERVGAKKFDMSLETQGIKLFGRDIPGFCRDIPVVPEKFEKKKFVFNLCSLVKFQSF